MESYKLLCPNTDRAVFSKNQVYVSSDYDKFNFMDHNRRVEKKHVARLERSIQREDYTNVQPILVDNDLNIIDGQHRFLACRNLGKPIYYMITETVTNQTIQLLNSSNKNWSMDDYIHFHAEKGNEEYKKFQLIMKITGWDSRSLTYWIVKNHEQRRSITLEGSLKIEMNQVEFDALMTAVSFLNIMSEFTGRRRTSRGSLYLHRAMRRTFGSPLIDKEKFLWKFENKPFIIPEHVPFIEAMHMLLDIYNHGVKEKNRVGLISLGKTVNLFTGAIQDDGNHLNRKGTFIIPPELLAEVEQENE